MLRVQPEIRWFVVNYLVLNAYCFVLGSVQGVWLLASSTDGAIPGWAGSPIEQVFWYSVSVVFFLPLVLGVPVLLVALLAWRFAIRWLGHPRLTAFAVASILVLVAAALIERTEPLYLGLVLAMALGYAAIVRLPPGEPRQASPDLKLAGGLPD